MFADNLSAPRSANAAIRLVLIILLPSTGAYTHINTHTLENTESVQYMQCLGIFFLMTKIASAQTEWP